MRNRNKSLIAVFAAVAALAAVASADTVGTLYDDFCCQVYNLTPDGTVSPNGLWVNIWNGFGSSGVEYNATQNEYWFYEEPKKATGGSTRSTLVRSNATWADFEASFDARTVKQLKNRPKNWEVDWILFRYTNTSNYYYFISKLDGIEFGKKQGSDAQVFLYTASDPDKVIGQWYHYHVKAVGNHFEISRDGSLIVNYTDTGMAPELASGHIDMYTEDARVNFDNFWVQSL
jgi:hypothetical protein